MKGFGFTIADVKDQLWNYILSCLIGLGLGILPGAGGGAAKILAYTVAKKLSKYPENIGTGVVATDTANNASMGVSLVPLLTLGIPGGTVTAIILGGLTLHGFSPGPLLFKTSGVSVYGVFAAFIIATFAMVFMMYFGMRAVVRILSVPHYLSLPIVMVLCVVGTYGVNHSMFDVWTALLFGGVGYVMIKFKYPLPPVILGFVLGPNIEQYLIRGLRISMNRFSDFFHSPFSAFFLCASVLMIGYMFYSQYKKKARCRASGENDR